ncbi:bacillithiol system redox-active protein YtxJ [Paenibacillus dendritiformis]|uniref:bacillithiol system redox-active protein YtxJ n=1 Tax=Paenibacillus dendritiformis TaxID=130049 RepID=UPI000DAABAF1|nr:bacillithiol system redox-active protein YtxJ [Paenibacillus dendritiformis]PZM63503.1 bacillithiol system redox-active protein YtxJ [Paenibacillus dendritiformis]
MRSIDTEQALQEWIDSTKEQTAVLFKHSTRCPISARANEEMGKVAEEFEPRGIAMGRILVVEHRDAALACTDKLGIQHESPQVIVMKEGQVVWHDSHHAITFDNVSSELTSSSR